ncbi:MAG: ABC transporter substrate-binding protein [Eubacterium sp.]|nr:ABC transporter substrate-binding protein [Eubacterium sp.]
MKKALVLLLSLLLALSLLAGCGNKEEASEPEVEETEAEETEDTEEAEEPAEIPEEVTVTDHAGREVTVPTNPEKVVVLDILPLPSVLTVYLDSCESILAMEPASMAAAKTGVLGQLYPEVLNVNTEIMEGEDVNIETLVSLEPELVYYNAGNAELAEKLENAGLTAVGFSPTKWHFDAIQTFNEWIALLDQIYPGRAEGAEATVADYANAVYSEIQEKTAGIADEDKQKVLFLFQYDENNMITSGVNFFGQWWCDAVGAVNAANEVAAEKSNAVITMEQVYAWDPDVIIITNFTPTQPQDLYDNAIGDDDWSTVKAVQDHRVYKMPMGTYRTYTPSTDTPLALKWMAQAVYPEVFADYDIRSDVKDYYKTLFGVELTDEQVEAMFKPNNPTGSWD